MATLVIDGYNLIRQSPTLLELEKESLERARLGLVHKLARYKQMKGHKIYVVFDAALTNNTHIEELKMGSIHVLFSEMGMLADTVIMKIAEKLKDKAVIVSSDNEILRRAKSAGCGYITSPEFEKKMNEALMYDESFEGERDIAHEKPAHKRWATYKKGPAKRQPKAKRRALRKLEDV
ncbi:NYN domain-containing protein [bacterium]|nr:NYN domain-containing protein [bacterium]